MAGSKFFSVMVVGDNPQELMAKYDRSLKVKPYIKFKYLEAEKLRKNAVKVFSELIHNHEKLSLNKVQVDYFNDKLKAISSMSSFEYYKTITEGLYYDENGNALSEENPDGKWDKYNLGKNFSYPLVTKNGKEVYSALGKDINWDVLHMDDGRVRLFTRIWELAVEGDEPNDSDEAKLKTEWEGRKTYFDKFKDIDEYIAHNCSYWNYAFLDKDGWHDVDDAKNDIEWVSEFYDKYVSKIKDNDTVTIYEYSVLDN